MGSREIIDDAYKAAGLDAGTIDTGAVILTGEALRRENARGHRQALVRAGRRFRLRHRRPSHGIDAGGLWLRRIEAFRTRRKRILNIDIGGGTTKLAMVEKGFVIATAAVHIGGRLQVVDEKGNIVRLDPAGRYHARAGRLRLAKGDVIDAEAARSGRRDHGR